MQITVSFFPIENDDLIIIFVMLTPILINQNFSVRILGLIQKAEVSSSWKQTFD